MNQMKTQVQRALNNIRPYLQADNGDIELIDITEDGIVTVKFLGACKTCPLSVMTLRAGVERTIMKEVPSVKRIEATS
jgi:Fe-S cluster biogenesis protein NfuA